MKNASNPVIVVQGGNFGSEAKGAVAAHLCLTRNVKWAVRTGAINAGHTVVYHGKRYAMQQLPTGWVNPDTNLVIGAGAYIHPPTLYREIAMINEAMPDRDVLSRLYIDRRCGIHDEAAEQASSEANRHHSIGATGKGCSEAVVNKIRNRNNGCKLFKEVWQELAAESADIYPCFGDTVYLLNRAVDSGDTVLIEGTQGTLLDLHLGPYPFTTSRMTSAANWIAEAGLSPALEYEVILVCRTFPIRVAGNSGPMKDEIEWTDLARDMNLKLSKPVVSETAMEEFEVQLINAAMNASYKVPRGSIGQPLTNLSDWTLVMRDVYRVAASELHRDALNLCSPDTVADLRCLFEMTTVTKKLRRIARLNFTDLRYAVAINRPSSLVLTFMDYVEPELAGKTKDSMVTVSRDVRMRAREYILNVENKLNVPVSLIGTGPNPGNLISPLSLVHLGV